MSHSVSASLAGVDTGPVGTQRSGQRLLSSVRGPTSHSHKGVDVLRVHHSFDSAGLRTTAPRARAGAPDQGSYRGGVGPAFQGLLQSHVPGPQEEWETTSHHQPPRAEPAPGLSVFQDGDFDHGGNSGSARGLGYVDRSDGRLLPRPHSSVVQEVPQDCRRGQGLSVQGSSLRTFHVASGVHQDVGAGIGLPTLPGYHLSQVPGRLPHKVSVSGSVPGVDSRDSAPPVCSGLRSRSREIGPRPFSDFHLHRHSVPHSSGNHETSRGQNRQHSGDGSLHSQRPSDSQGLAFLPRIAGLGREAGPVWQAPHPPDPSLSQTSVQGRASFAPAPGSRGQRGYSGHQLVDRPEEPQDGPTIGQISARHSASYRRQQGQLGSPRSGLPSLRLLDLRREWSIHQRSRTSGCPEGYQSKPFVLVRQEGAGRLGQLDRGGLHQPPRGNQVLDSSEHNPRAVSVGHGQRADHSSPSHPRPLEPASGLVVPKGRGRQHGVDSLPTSRPDDLVSLGHASSGSDGDSAQSSASGVRQSGTGSSGLRSRRNVLLLERSGRVRLSAVADDRASSDQASVTQLSDHDGGSQVAQSPLVSSAASESDRRAQEAPRAGRPLAHASQQHSAPADPFPGSARLSSIFDEATSQGFSREVSQRIASGGRADSTHRIYDSKWERFTVWCTERDTYPLEASVAQVCDFFNMLFSEGLAPVTIEGYRSAIDSVWAIQGRSLAGNHPVVQLIASFKRERPRSVRTLPRWDLNLVLRFLRRPEFAPDRIAVDPRNFAQKTAFLTLFAVARRCGDVHAIDPKRIIATPSSLILVPHPGYLPKIKKAAEGQEQFRPMVVRKLSNLCPDSSELPLCPVRALLAYDKWAKKQLPHRSRFFLSTKKTNAKPVVKATLAGWIKKLILRAYDTATDQDLALVQASTHEIRALSTSLAQQATFALEDIISAASWATPSVFASYYLRDVSGVEGGLNVIGPIIAAGQRIH